MRTVAVDTETALIAPGRAAPPMVCTTWATPHGDRGLLHTRDPKCLKFWRRWLREYRIIGARFAFDAAVVLARYPELAADLFKAYEEGRIEDVQINQRLIDIANGCLEGRFDRNGKRIRYRYSVKALNSRLLQVYRDKGADTYRKRYWELYPILDVKKWPKEARSYAMDDASDLIPMDRIQQASGVLFDAPAQAYADFALYLQTCRGIRTERKACKRLIRETRQLLLRCKKRCLKVGLIDPKTGKKSRKVAMQRMLASIDPDRDPKKVAKEIKALVAEHRERQQANVERKIARIAFQYDLDADDMKLARKRLAKVLEYDVSHEKLLKKWEAYGYPAALYRALRSELETKARAFSVTLENGIKVQLTKTGQVTVNAETCKASGDKALQAFATLGSANALIKKAERMLLGAKLPLQTSYLSLVETGRTSSRAEDKLLIGDNFQNFRRSAMKNELGDELPGQRECIVARKGYVLCSIDFDAAEMRSFAQLALWHLGWSKLAEVLNAGRDPHLALAAKSILRIPYKVALRRLKAGDEEVINARQYAKIPNFALLGGGGWRILPAYAKGMGINLSNEQARELYKAFHETWTEVAYMHKHYKSFVHKRFKHPVSGRLRYVTRFAQACNNPFQGLTADAAKLALCRLAKAEYVPGGELYGAYSVLFMHDEVIFELPEDRASEFAWRATRIMIDAYNVFTPDVPMTASPALMRRLTKGAKTITHPTRKDRDGNPLLLLKAAENRETQRAA